MMDKERLNKYILFFPALLAQKDKSLILSEEEYKKYEKTVMVEAGKMKKKIRVGLLEDMLNDDYCYESLEILFDSTRVRLPVYFLSKFKMLNKNFYKKTELIEMFDKAIDSNQLNLTEKGKQRLQILKNKMSVNAFKEKYNDYKYNLDIEGKDYSFDVKKFVSILSLPNDKYESFLKKEEKIEGLNKREYMYALAKFFLDENIFDNYMMPEQMEKRFYNLITYNVIDYESVNSMIESDAYLYEGVDLNKTIRDYLYKEMPANLSTIEKAIYLYVKACKLFTYDEKFYAANQKGVEAVKHQDIKHLSEIDLNHRDIVCYEFTAIYGKLLEELGINFEVDYTVTNEYGSGHNNLAFKHDKYLVEVDSVTTIFQGDLIRAKTGFPLVGIKSINVNNETAEEFKSMVERIYEMVNIESMSFDDALEKYESKIANRENIDIEEKLKIYFEKLQKSGEQLERMDSLGYTFMLCKALFTKEERENNLNLGVFKTKKDDEEKIVLVVTCNKKSFSSHKDENKYFIYDLEGNIIKINKNDLESQLDKGGLVVVDGKRTKVPGVEGRTWIN